MPPLPPGCFCFPQALESLLALLPRPWLDRFQIAAFPAPISEGNFQRVLDFWKGRRIALVRQSASLVTYQAGSSSSSWIATALTTKGHPGPFSLLAELGADFLVVRQEPDPETFAWRGKHQGDPDPAETFRRMEAYRQEEESLPGVVNCGDVRWEDYDLVITLDIPVPTRIVQRARSTLWAYFSIEAGGPLVEQSLLGPAAGYHLFLNHHFRRYRVRPPNRAHMLEFPFSFQSRRSWSALAAHLGIGGQPRSGVVADLPSAGEIPEPRDAGVHLMGVDNGRLDLAGLAALYGSKKYALRLDPRRRWGNWLVEVVQAGCLFLGRPDTLDNLSPLLPALAVRDYREARAVMARLDADPALFSTLHQLQSDITEHVAFRRPLADLTAHARRFFHS